MKTTHLLLAAVLLSLIVVSHPTTPVWAQEATAGSQTTQNLRQRIEKIAREKKEQIQGIISNLDSDKRGFIGQVQRINEESITIKTNKETIILPITSDVQLLSGTKTVKLTDIAVDNWLVVMGVTKDDNFKPLRILVSSEDIRPTKHFIGLGSVTKLSATSLTITTRNGGDSVEITTTSKTIYEDLKGGVIKRTDLETDTQVLVIATEAGSDKTARRIRIMTVHNDE